MHAAAMKSTTKFSDLCYSIDQSNAVADNNVAYVHFDYVFVSSAKIWCSYKV